MERYSTPGSPDGENHRMEQGNSWPQRRDELAAKLAQRAVACPGLYPFREAADFLRVAQDQAGDEAEAVCRILELMWQRPEEAVQWNAQSLISRGKGWGGDARENPPIPCRKISGVQPQAIKT